MSVSGHNSLSSLVIYERVRDDEKLMMGMQLTYNLLKPKEACQLKRKLDSDELKEIEDSPEREQLALPCPSKKTEIN